MRDPGAHMGVSADGDFVGSLSGGCIEAAVVAEALEALKDDAARVTRFGSGSEYLDIKLPCGGGLDIHFQPLGDSSFVAKCREAVVQRNPFSIALSANGEAAEFVLNWQQTNWRAEASEATIGHWPAPKLLIIGHGAAMASLATQASSMGLEACVLTPDERLAGDMSERDIAAGKLTTPNDVSAIMSDPWTAIIFMFHDHDWEGKLMAHALAQPHFYFGAMGGRKAHAFRTGILTELGIAQSQIDKIHAPIGLFHSARDPDTLALSALAQVIEAYQNHDFAERYG